MLNKVTLIGRLGADPESKTMNSGAEIVNFSIATSESYTDKKNQSKSRENRMAFRGDF